jgi:hypothetical protein
MGTTRSRLLSTLGVAWLLALPRMAMAQRVDDMRAAIRAELQQAQEAWNRGDLSGHVAMYTDSATFMTPRGPLPGRGRIAETLTRGFWSNGKPFQQLRFDNVMVRPLGQSHALVTGPHLDHQHFTRRIRIDRFAIQSPGSRRGN